MLKRLLGLMTAAEEAYGRAIGLDIYSPTTRSAPTPEDYARAADDPGYPDFGFVYTYAVFQGIPEECAFTLGSAYADQISEGVSKAYAIFYAAAFSVARSLLGSSEQWARIYAQACAHAVAARESMGVAAVYGHSIADGASPEVARVVAHRYGAQTAP